MEQELLISTTSQLIHETNIDELIIVGSALQQSLATGENKKPKKSQPLKATSQDQSKSNVNDYIKQSPLTNIIFNLIERRFTRSSDKQHLKFLLRCIASIMILA